MPELQSHPAEASLVAGFHHAVVVRPEQPGVRVIQRLQHGFDGAVGLLTGFDGFFQCFLTQPLPADCFERLGIDIALIHKTPALHHQLLCVIESEGLRSGQQADQHADEQPKCKAVQ